MSVHFKIMTSRYRHLRMMTCMIKIGPWLGCWTGVARITGCWEEKPGDRPRIEWFIKGFHPSYGGPVD